MIKYPTSSCRISTCSIEWGSIEKRPRDETTSWQRRAIAILGNSDHEIPKGVTCLQTFSGTRDEVLWSQDYEAGLPRFSGVDPSQWHAGRVVVCGNPNNYCVATLLRSSRPGWWHIAPISLEELRPQQVKPFKIRALLSTFYAGNRTYVSPIIERSKKDLTPTKVAFDFRRTQYSPKKLKSGMVAMHGSEAVVLLQSERPGYWNVLGSTQHQNHGGRSLTTSERALLRGVSYARAFNIVREVPETQLDLTIRRFSAEQAYLLSSEFSTVRASLWQGSKFPFTPKYTSTRRAASTVCFMMRRWMLMTSSTS